MTKRLFYAVGNAKNKYISGNSSTDQAAAIDGDDSGFLRWQIVSRVRDEVIVHWIDGTRFAAKRGMTGATGNIYAGLP